MQKARQIFHLIDKLRICDCANKASTLILYDRHTVRGDLDLTLPPVLFNGEISDIKPMMRRKALARIQLARSYTLITLKCHRFFGIVRWIYNRHRYDPVFFRGDHAIAGIAQSTARMRFHQRKRLTRRGQ